MFKRILIPTDGSPIAAKAVRAGVTLAAEIGASVMGYYNEEPVPPHLYGDGHLSDKRHVTNFERRSREYAERCLDEVRAAAKAAGVPFEAARAKFPAAYQGIIATARKRKCDAIFIASHGRRGLARLLLGSVTQQVLSHSNIPVLVYR